MNQLNEIIDKMAQEIHGMTKTEALAKKVCLECKQAITDASFYSPRGRREYEISAYCEPCFDKITKGDF